MKKVLPIIILVSFHFFGTRAQPGYPKPDWRLVTSKYPTESTIIAGYSVNDFGAKGDGLADDTEAFQQALKAMDYYGGGTVFVPAGKYIITQPLDIYENVTLRGEWEAPDENGVHGTTIMVKAGKGDENAKPFITLHPSAGVKELNFWYPDQDIDQVITYPWCIHQLHRESATVENVTLVNPYLGIKIGPEANALHYIHNVYGTPLKTGLQFDRCFDIGRLEGIFFNPGIWSESQLPGAPDKKAVLNHLQGNGTGVVMYRSDWEYGYNVKVEGYKVGFEISGSPMLDLENGVPEAYPNAQFYGFEFAGCQKAVLVKGVNPYGVAFTKSVFQGNEIGFEAAETFNSVVLFHDCRFSGQKSLVNKGNGHFALQHCSVVAGDFVLENGTAAVVDSKISKDVSSVHLFAQIQQAELLGNQIDPSCRVIYDKNNKNINIGPSGCRFNPLPDFQQGKERNFMPGSEKLFVITGEPYNADLFGENDCQAAIQKAIDDAFVNGGGIVFFPSGSYKVKDKLVLKEGVELRGTSDVPHHTESAGSVILVETGKGGDEGDTPFIRMKPGSGIQGMSFHYPGQNYAHVSPFPFMVRGEGENIYLVNISASNPYRMLDFSSHRCDNHYLSYVTGSPLRVGLQIGKGTTGGYVKNTQFNPHYWGFARFDNAPKYPAYMDYIWEYQKKNLDAVILGDARGQAMFQNFVFGSLYGIHLIKENGKGPSGYIHGHGSDGAEISAYIEGIGDEGINFVNTQLVTVQANKQVYIHFDPGKGKPLGFYNTLFWGTPVETAIQESGNLSIQLANFHRTGRSGINVLGGNLYLVNTYFWEPSRYLRVESVDSPPVLKANIYRAPKRKFPLGLEIRKLPAKPPLPDIYLSGLSRMKSTGDFSDQLRSNKSVLDNPLQIDGVHYEQGLGVYSDSGVTYAIQPSYKHFVAVAGLDDEIVKFRNYQNTMVIFQVWVDGRLMGESPEMTMGYNRVWYFDIPIPDNSQSVTLNVIGFGGAGHADWANAGFTIR